MIYLAERTEDVYRGRIPCPGECGRMVESMLDTDGNGEVIEVAVQPCHRCRSNLVIVPPGHRPLICRGCDRSFVRKRQRGRLPHYCPRCR